MPHSNLRTAIRSRFGRNSSLRSRKRRTSPLRAGYYPERLEQRALLTTYMVNTPLDTVDANPGDGLAQDESGNTSLRAAIMEANVSSGSDAIELPEGTFALSIAGRDEDAAATGDLDITDTDGTLRITGAGSSATILDAQQLDRIFHVAQSVTVELHDLMVTNGKVVSDTSIGDGHHGAGLLADFYSDVTIVNSDFIANSAPESSAGVEGHGGAIGNKGVLTIDDSRFERNTAISRGGAIDTGGTGASATIRSSTFVGNTTMTGGGAISTHNVLHIEDSTFSENSAGRGGGAIDNNGSGNLTLINSTISGNHAMSGGGIANGSTSKDLHILNSTIVGNSASYKGGGLVTWSSEYLPTIENTLIANNTADSDGPDVTGTVSSLGHNLVGDGTDSAGFDVPTDQVGTSASPIDPLLGPLADNGGPTHTHALQPDSPAIDAANTADAPTYDQRGIARPQGVGADIGAYERATGDNQPPVAVDDSYNTDEEIALTVSAPGVLANDSDFDGDTLTAALASSPSDGTLGFNSDGSFTYTPNANFYGTDSFTYRANDGTVNSDVATVSITVTRVNHRPVANDDAYAVDEDITLDVAAPGVLSNDSDLDGDTLTPSITTHPSHGTLSLAADGSFIYTPDANYNGSDSFTYTITDGWGGSDSATVQLDVASVNDLPNAVDDTATTDEDSSVAIDILANDSDVDGDTLTLDRLFNGSNGTTSVNADGTVTYVPNPNFHGEDRFTYSIADGNGGGARAFVTVTVNPVNDAPVAGNDSYSTSEDTALTVASPGVLSNDTDVDGNTLATKLGTGPSSGTVSLNQDGSFTYTPDADFNGTDGFTYTVSDGNGGSDIATVDLTITSVNDAPAATGDSYTVGEDAVLTVAAPGVLGNDSDADGDSLTAAVEVDPSDGSLALNTDGSFTYTPNANFHGTDSFTYTVSDGNGGADTATVALTVTSVNDSPVAVNDGYSVDEDSTLTISAPGVLGNDSDVDGDQLTTAVATGPSHGTLTLNADGSFTYAPDGDYNGSDSFTYRANDGTADSNVATIELTINSVNDAPVAVNDRFSIDEDSTLSIAAAGVLANDSDVDGGTLTAAVSMGPSNGTLSLASDGAFTYTPNADYNGSDSFTYTASDGTLESNVATVEITVNAVNDAPVAGDDNYTLDEDSTLNVEAAGVLGNDSDIDGDSLTATLVTDVSSGSLALSADGSFTYNPDADFNGTDSFTYSVSDGALDSNIATVEIVVNAINDAPVAENDQYLVDEDATLNISGPGVLGNDSDIDDDPLTAALVTDVRNGSLTFSADGSFIYTPSPNFNGSDSFTYETNDGATNSSTATVEIAVASVNDAPTAAGDSYTITEDSTLTTPAAGVLANDDDVDGDALTATIGTAATHGLVTLNSDGSFTYVPDANYHGNDSFTYRASDAVATSGTATVMLTVQAVNDAPTAGADTYSTDEDTVLQIAAPGVLGNDTDVDGDGLTASVAIGPSHGTLTLNPDGSFAYTPNANYNGSDSFTYTVDDGNGDTDTGTVYLEVSSINDAAVAVDDSYSIDEDLTLSVPAPGVLDNDTDVDNDPLTSVLEAGPTNGTLTLGTDGDFTYTPDANFNGTDSFTYRANDAAVDSSVATVEILVNPVNDAPESIVLDDSSIVENTDTSSAVTVGAFSANDVDDASHTFSLVSGTGDADNGLFQISGNLLEVQAGTELNHEAQAAYSVRVQANDGDATAEDVFTITVTDANDAPVAAALELGTEEDVPVAVELVATDEDGDQLSFSIVFGPSSGTLTPVAGQPGDYVYTPDADFTGSDSFVYTADDGTISSEEATVVITVTPPPVSEVEIDIKPGSASNPISPRSRGVTKVAILSTASFDAVSNVDAKTLTFGRTGDEPSLIVHKKHGTPRTDVEDVDGDGLLDLVAAFSTDETGLQVGDTQAVLRGQTVHGDRIEGQDIVRIVGKRKSSKAEGELTTAADLHVLDDMWTNWAKPMDVNDDGRVSALDALLGINALNRGRGGVLPMLPEDAEIDFPFVDTNGDGRLSALDSLLVINQLNRHNQTVDGEDTTGGSNGWLEQVDEAHAVDGKLLVAPMDRDELERRGQL